LCKYSFLRGLERGKNVFVRVPQKAVGEFVLLIAQVFRNRDLPQYQLDLSREMQRYVRGTTIRATEGDSIDTVVEAAAIAH